MIDTALKQFNQVLVSDFYLNLRQKRVIFENDKYSKRPSFRWQ